MMDEKAQWTPTETVAMAYRVARQYGDLWQMKGLFWIIWGAFFLLSLALLPALVRAGTGVMVLWGVGLPLVAMGACTLWQRMEGSRGGPMSASRKRALRTANLWMLILTVITFAVCAFCILQKFEVASVCGDLTWLFVVIAVIELLKSRNLLILVEIAILVGVGFWAESATGLSPVAVLGVGVGAAWICRGLLEFGRKNAGPQQHG